jgi:hypothetical protein
MDITNDADRECDQIRQRVVADLTALKTLHTLEQTSNDQLQTTEKLIGYEHEHTASLAQSAAANRTTASTNDRQIYYEQQQIIRLQLWGRLFAFIYWLLALAAVIYIWTMSKSTNTTKKVVYTALIWLYPHASSYLTNWSSEWGGRLYSLMAIQFGGPLR